MPSGMLLNLRRNSQNWLKSLIAHSILELVENLERILQDYRNNEMVAQFKTINFDPVLTIDLQSLELCAANNELLFTTKKIFRRMKKQIKEVIFLDIIHNEFLFTIMRKKIFTVAYDHNEKKLVYKWYHWDHEGKEITKSIFVVICYVC
ncbi:hypothetical protein Ahy_B07g087910 [Arachis hypogaea]|uniref:Uncharacterized protein n=1 Tax=Arachis hypogaea TaxID=3818 RepID=A0A444YD99_ARAHY|nr:hypothetical protein Ahy_B07g087910 [Arachis hypogaea]